MDLTFLFFFCLSVGFNDGALDHRFYRLLLIALPDVSGEPCGFDEAAERANPFFVIPLLLDGDA